MPQPYKVKCLGAKYDEETGMLVLNCWFNSLQGPRLVVLNKKDFHFKNPGQEVPDAEMHKTARLFSKFKHEFNLIIEDDPNREQITADNYAQYARNFSKNVGHEMEEVSHGLMDEAGQVSRRLGRLMDEGKLDVKKLMQHELTMRAQLGDMR